MPWDLATTEEFHRLFSHAIDRWLDSGAGSCLLKDPECALIVAHTLLHFDGDRCHILAFVVMPNHVHVLIIENPDWTLDSLIQSWKRHSAREINKRLGTSGSVWMKDYFDRIVRSEGHLLKALDYIRQNPKRANLSFGSYRLYEAEFVKTLI